MRPFFPALMLAAGLIGAAGAVLAQPAIVIEGQPALTKEDGPCWNDSSRFVDCGNGTVTDTTTGLVWLQRANCTEFPGTGGTNANDWPTATEAAAALEDGLCGLTDGSEPGDWRLPTADEWEATLAWARDGLACTGASAPTWTNDAGNACYSMSVTSFTGITATNFWSSSIDAASTGFADVGNLTTGSSTGHVAKFGNAGIWPVRGFCTDYDACPNW